MSSILFALFVGACVADDGQPRPEIDSHTAALQHATMIQQTVPTTEEAGREAVRLYRELAARLEARGVAPEQMQAAVDAGDAERARELFGFTPEELDAANARVLELAAEFGHAGEARGSPSRRA